MACGVILLLLVGVAEHRIDARRAVRLRHGLQNFQGAAGIAFFVVKQRKRGDRIFRRGLQLDGGAELGFGLARLIIQPVEAAQQKMILDAGGVQAHNLLILFDGEVENGFGVGPACRPASRQWNAGRCGPADGGHQDCSGRG